MASPLDFFSKELELKIQAILSRKCLGPVTRGIRLSDEKKLQKDRSCLISGKHTKCDQQT